jgi:hypothetical protein
MSSKEFPEKSSLEIVPWGKSSPVIPIYIIQTIYVYVHISPGNFFFWELFRWGTFSPMSYFEGTLSG